MRTRAETEKQTEARRERTGATKSAEPEGGASEEAGRRLLGLGLGLDLGLGLGLVLVLGLGLGLGLGFG